MMLFKLLSQSDRRCFRHTVLSLMTRGRLGRIIESVGVPVHALGIRQGRMPGPFAIWKLIRRVRTLRPDILQGWMYHGNLAALFAQEVSPGRIPLVWNIRQSIDDIGKEKKFTHLVIRIGALFASRPVRIIYNAGVSRKRHAKLGYPGRKSLVIPNGFDCVRFSPDKTKRIALRFSLGLDNDALLIGLVARFHPVKDHAGFLQAAALLNRRFPEVNFVLAGQGTGPDNAGMTVRIRRLGIDGRVHLLGARNDVPEIMAALDIATTASAWGEAFPNVIGEAMACGIPCVVTDVGDSARVVGETGVVVPPKDPEALAKGWESVLKLSQTDRDLLGRAARGRILNLYSIEKIDLQYETLYEDIVGRYQRFPKVRKLSSDGGYPS
jgi:glycosyltransferase involved in cell wall biosynthesis